MDFSPTNYPTPPALTTPEVAALWAWVKHWFTVARPGRETRLKTLSISTMRRVLKMNSPALHNYLSGREVRGKVAGPPAACHLGPLVHLLRADYGLLLPAQYVHHFTAGDTLL